MNLTHRGLTLLQLRLASTRLASSRIVHLATRVRFGASPAALLDATKNKHPHRNHRPTSIHGTARLLAGIRDLIAISSHQRTPGHPQASGRVQGEPLVRGLPPPPATLSVTSTTRDAMRNITVCRFPLQHAAADGEAVLPLSA
ncbi:hypothetical protein HDV57DRAFT_249211 [Trichoderma longibrachiatum]